MFNDPRRKNAATPSANVVKAYESRQPKPKKLKRKHVGDPNPPSPQAVAAALRFDAATAVRPLKPPGSPACRVCWGEGCAVCGVAPRSGPRARQRDDRGP